MAVGLPSLFRLLALLFFSSLFAGPAHAAFPAIPDPSVCSVGPCYEYTSGASGSVWVTSPSVACSQWVGRLFQGNAVTTSTYNGSNCVLGWVGGSSGYALSRRSVSPVTPIYSCPDHSIYSIGTNTCTCDPGYIEDGASRCVSPIPPPDVCDPVKGLPTPVSSYETFVAGMGAADAKNALGKSRLGCATGCIFVGNTVASATGPKGTTFVMSEGKFTGFSCADGTPDTGLGPLENRCSSQDMCPGTVNGVDVCVRCSSTGTSETTSSTPTPAVSAPHAGSSAPSYSDGTDTGGGGTGTGGGSGGGKGSGTTYGTSPSVGGGTGTGADVPGGTTTQSQTTCTGLSCTTTTKSSTNLGDGTYKNSSSEQVVPKSEFCKNNPLDKSCISGSGSFGGTCDAGPTCAGDAVQCAAAAAAFKSACALERGPMPEVAQVVDTKVDSGIVKNAGWGPDNGSCPSPKTIQFSFASIDMPFDLLCTFANGIRPLVIGLAWLSAAFSFFGFARRGT